MKILMLNYEFPPLGGGYGQYHLLAKNLVKNGHEVLYITSRIKGQYKHEFVDGIEVIRVATFRKDIDRGSFLDMFAYVFSAWFKLGKIVENFHPDACHLFFGIPSGVLGFHPRIKKLPRVLSCLGSDVPNHNPDRFNLAYKLLTPLVKKIWRSMNIVAANSNGLCEEIRAISPSQNVICVNNGIDTYQFKPIEREHDDCFRFLYVGRLIPLKNLPSAIEFVNEIKKKTGKKVRFDIVGSGIVMEELKNLAKKLGCEKDVKFVGYIGHEEIHHYYQKADFYLQFSKTEGMSNTIMEAMSSGVIPIVTNVGGVAELIEDNKNGFLYSPDKQNALIDIVIDLISHPENFQKMREASRGKILNCFSAANLMNNYLDLYKTAS